MTLVLPLKAKAGDPQATGPLDLREDKDAETDTTRTLIWTPVPGYGYLFFVDGALVSRTNDPLRSSVKVSKAYNTVEVAAIAKGASQTFP